MSRSEVPISLNNWVQSVIGPFDICKDMSWGLVDTTVLHVRSRTGGPEYVVKWAGLENHHINREITAHESFTAPLVSARVCPILTVADRESNILITSYLPGTLLQGAPSEYDPHIWVQAGRALRLLHAQSSITDPDFETNANSQTLRWLDSDHRIPAEQVRQIRSLMKRPPASESALVPTHGDFHPRNWLTDNGTFKVIDFGRADYRPAYTDLHRMAARYWNTHPNLAEAFFHGYGTDPRSDEVWNLSCVREAVGTAAWAYHVGDFAFEAEGLAQLHDVLG